MKIAGIQIRRRIFVSAGLVIAVTSLWVYWSRAHQPVIAGNQATQSSAFIKIAGAGQGVRDKLLEEQAEYLDPTPLFLPTNKNFSQGALPGWEPGQVFRDYEPRLNFAESALPEYGAVVVPGRESLLEILGRGNDAPFAGFGQSDRNVPPLERRNGYIEIKALKSGLLSISEPLNYSELPQVDFNPLEFVVAVASGGLVGDPLLIASSGKDEVDAKLRDYLVRIYRIGDRLAPGRYSILIGR